jgi:hypothetical protein
MAECGPLLDPTPRSPFPYFGHDTELLWLLCILDRPSQRRLPYSRCNNCIHTLYPCRFFDMGILRIVHMGRRRRNLGGNRWVSSHRPSWQRFSPHLANQSSALFGYTFGNCIYFHQIPPKPTLLARAERQSD